MTRDMTTGSPLRRILAFCAPLLIGNLFQQFYNLADSIIVGQHEGANALGSIGCTGSITFLFFSFCNTDCGFLFTFSNKNRFTFFTFRFHLLLHGILNFSRR